MTRQFSWRDRWAKAGFCAAAAAATLALGGFAPMTGAAAAETPSAASQSCPAILNRVEKKLQDESDQNLCQYAGKVVLIVNTASYCGFTGQYKGLEDLYARYSDKGLVVLGFPSNDFSQEPGNNKEIADFCYNTYGVKFPMFSKTEVTGQNADPLYKELADATGQKPRWNFYKYLIDRQGHVVASYSSLVGPSDAKLTQAIERLLAQ